MKKKELLKLIEELQIKVTLLESQIALLKPNTVSVPTVWTSPHTTQLDTCQHEYPNPWLGITPPSCKKCGQQAYQYTVTCSSGGTTIPNTTLTEYIQKNTKN